ncbi:MAG: Mrp/NBP35 family ATP-binding protein [Gammaproteobacteria bacterium]|nr:Mrp/NBP35 family ATP-binding protein [Gammaproteobacteria bacterium]
MLSQPIRAYPTQLPTYKLKEVTNTIVVASGKGGVGKSTVAVNLAVALAQLGARVGLLDADIYGPSIPLMMGINGRVVVEDNRYQPFIAHGVQVMSIGCLTDLNQAMIWRGPMLAKTLIQMIDATAWQAVDYLIIDLPPGTGDIQLSLVQKIPVAGAVVVSTPQAISTLDADKAIQMFKRTNINVFGLVENMSEHVCSQCGHKEAIFGQQGTQGLCDRYQLPLLATIPLRMELRTCCDEGRPEALDIHEATGQRWRDLALKVANQ